MTIQDDAFEDLPDEGLANVFVDLLSALSSIKELSEIGCQQEDEESLIKHALEALVHNQDMERCSFFKLVEDDRLVNVTGLSYLETIDDEEYETPARPQEFRVGEGLIGLAAKTRTLQHCHNSASDERFSHESNSDNSRLPGSIISVPVFVANLELVGVLNVSHPEPYFFTEWHIRLLEVYKNIFGQLISNFRLIRKMETKIQIRTAKLQRAYEDIKTLKEYYQNIAVLDVLTGLYNRRYFYDQMKVALANFQRYQQPLCVLLLDVDYFKRINDRYGHDAGDNVLVALSDVLRREVRANDILVRFGGEEFVIVFTNTSCENGVIFAERIRKSIAQTVIGHDGHKISVTVSIGLFCLDKSCQLDCGDENPLGGSQVGYIDSIIKYADMALYKAKAQGRNQVVQFCQSFL
jgi:diguanylate cyclase (GGDEF)-like protein